MTPMPKTHGKHHSKSQGNSFNPLLNVVTGLFFNKKLNHIRTVLLIFLFFVGTALYFHKVEEWTFIECVYFTVVTITTIGYGDYHPTKDEGRLVTIFVIIFGLVFVFGAINGFAMEVIRYTEENALASLNKINPKTSDPSDLVGMKAAMNRQHTFRIILSILGVLIVIFGGATYFTYFEGWTFISSVYYCVVTTTTVGYGDLTVANEGSRLFSIFYILISVIVVAASLGNLGAIQIEKDAAARKEKALKRPLDFNMIRELDLDGDGVDQVEFLVGMLVQTLDLDREQDIEPWLNRFKQLDKDGSGRLDKEDIDALEREEKERLEKVHQESVRKGLQSIRPEPKAKNEYNPLLPDQV
jgi:hypothetical protein